MKLEILTPTKSLFKGEITLVQLPGTKGSFEILKNHAPIISSLEKGRIKIVDVNKLEAFVEIEGGVVECKTNEVVVLASDAIIVEE